VTPSYDEVTSQLRDAYARSADARDSMEKYPWKLDARKAFLDRLVATGAKRLLEVGAGTGQDSVFFRDAGLDVVATDLTPEMVAHCAAKGLDAHVMDVLHLDLPAESFDAVWTINTLLHVPNADLPAALREIERVVRPDGLVFLGVYGGTEVGEGIYEDDRHEPKRFFSFRTSEQIEAFANAVFEVVDFHVVELETGGRPGGFTFQSLTLRRR
jgi:SAM-dependent methyltransferase